jgi:hypothetical protein
LRAAADAFPDADAKAATLTKRVAEAEAEFIAEQERRVLAINALRGELAQAQAERRAAERAIVQLDELEDAERETIGALSPNLDEVTPVHSGTVVAWYDPSAPYRYVSRATFDRESERRRRIVHAAQSAARAAFDSAHKAWSESLGRNWVGRLIDDGNGPTFTLPTWSSIVAAGEVARWESVAAKAAPTRGDIRLPAMAMV